MHAIQRAIIGITVLVGLSLSACSSGSLTEKVPARTIDAEAFSDVFSEGCSADFEPATGELGELAQTVVLGTVSAIVPGRTFASSERDPASVTSIVLVLADVVVVSGGADAAAGKVVYVELPAPFGMHASEFHELLPTGASAIFYLEEAATEEQTPILDPAAGRLGGTKLWQLISPQEMFLETDAGALEVMTGEILKDVSIADLATALARARDGDASQQPRSPG